MNLIFDFDGTLVDSFKCVMEKSNLLAEEYHFRKVKEEEIEHLRDLSSKEMIEYLQVPLYLLPKLIYSIRKHLQNEIKNLKPVDEIKEVIQSLYEAGCTLGILTSNSKKNVLAWFAHHDLQQFFKFIQVESNYFSKKTALKKALKTYQLDKSKTYYICDETRDIEASLENEVQSIAVSWGYHSEKTLAKYHPNFIVHHPRDILAICGLN